MITYQPECEVRLIKAARRAEVAPGGSATSRRVSGLSAINLTPFLGEGSTVRTHKSVWEPAGGFVVTLQDRYLAEVGDSLYGLIEPMDLVEIRMARRPDQSGSRSAGQLASRLPIVMRGFVTSVTRSETMRGGRPQRHVVISGQDFGKLWQILRIYYLNNSVVGENVLHVFRFFHKYSVEAKVMSANEFLAQMVERVLNPYVAQLVALANGTPVGSAVVKSLALETALTGNVAPLGVQMFTDGPVYQLMAQALDVGAFNELFIEDRDDGVYIVARPIPFVGLDGKVIQAGVPAIDRHFVTAADVVSLNLSRSDQGVANYYWVDPQGLALLTNTDLRLAASGGAGEEIWMPLTRLNCSADRYGMRKMEVGTRLMAPEATSGDAEREAQQARQNQTHDAWYEDLRKRLARLNHDNVVFESGTITLKGDEQIRAGRWLFLQREQTMSSFYAVGVTHDFAPLAGFTTTVRVERGTNFADRIQRGESPYLAELTARGV